MKSLLSHKLWFLLLFLFAHTKHEEQEKKVKEIKNTRHTQDEFAR
jgi:hypothetical protein